MTSARSGLFYGSEKSEAAAPVAAAATAEAVNAARKRNRAFCFKPRTSQASPRYLAPILNAYG